MFDYVEGVIRWGNRCNTAARACRRRLFTVWAVALTALHGLLFTSMTALTVALWATDPAYPHTNPVGGRPRFFALGGILIIAGLASQIRGRQIAGPQQAILALLALAVAGLLGDASSRSSEGSCSWRPRRR